MQASSIAVYELRGLPFRTRLMAALFPDRARGVLSFTALILLVGPGGWIGAWAFAYLVFMFWRAFRVGLRADATRVEVVNVYGKRNIAWTDVDAIRSPASSGAEPPVVEIAVQGGALRRIASSTSVQASLALGKERRRRIALELAALGRSYGHGIPAGTDEEISEQFRAGLFDDRDPAAHAAW